MFFKLDVNLDNNEKSYVFGSWRYVSWWMY